MRGFILAVLLLQTPEPPRYVVIDSQHSRAYGTFNSYEDANVWGLKRLTHSVVYKLEGIR